MNGPSDERPSVSWWPIDRNLGVAPLKAAGVLRARSARQRPLDGARKMGDSLERSFHNPGNIREFCDTEQDLPVIRLTGASKNQDLRARTTDASARTAHELCRRVNAADLS